MTSPFGAVGTPRVAIIGCGFGGIAAGVKLTRAGVHTFTIFEQSDGIGGTWWDNRYPGAATDTLSHLYCYSFMRYDWAGTHASQRELQQYLEIAVDRYGLRGRIQLNTGVTRLDWDDERHVYRLQGRAGDLGEFDAVISAVGMLNVPRYPDWPGLEDFEGPAFHTARWEAEHDLGDKRVAVVGSGSSAAQVVPALAPVAGEVIVFQREAGWMTEKNERQFPRRERARLRSPLAWRLRRLRQFVEVERGLASGMLDVGSATHRAARARAESFIGSVFEGREDLAQVMTPDHPFMCKRLVKSSDYYPAFLRDNVTAVPRAVQRVTPSGLVDDAGIEHEVDVIVTATGFQPADYLSTLEVTGRDGRRLHDVWNGEPEAFLGITVPGFPNLYLLYGPNTNGGAIVFHLERQAEFAARAIRRMARRGVTAIEVRPGIHAAYNRWLQRGIEGTAFVGPCSNYFRAASGKVVTQWPFTASLYWLLTRTLGTVSSSARRAADR